MCPLKACMLGNGSAAFLLCTCLCLRRAGESWLRDLQVPSQIVLGECRVLGGDSARNSLAEMWEDGFA